MVIIQNEKRSNLLLIARIEHWVLILYKF